MSERISNEKNVSILAQLPCGLKSPYLKALQKFCNSLERESGTAVELMEEGKEGVSLFQKIEFLNGDQLPDILIGSDINVMYHKEFRERFIDTDFYQTPPMENGNSFFRNIEFQNKSLPYYMLAANLLVLVRVKKILPDFPETPSWGELLKEQYRKKLIFRGDKNSFCSGVLLPFYKLFGESGVKALGKATLDGLHPSQMVRNIDDEKGEAGLYIMPLFFAEKIQNRKAVQIYSPKEGAIVSPIQMLVKKSLIKETETLVQFLTGIELGQLCGERFFPAYHNKVDNSSVDVDDLLWLGWDFLNQYDIGKLKQQLKKTFLENFSREKVPV
jgi:ABC-type Fe3+ transport system substrate-binding protein